MATNKRSAPGQWYEQAVLPVLLDFTCGLHPISELRRQTVPLAWGRCLEVGIGTGLNLPHYAGDRVTELVGIDPAGQMHKLARKRAVRSGLHVDIRRLSAENLPFESNSFDSLVCTFTLCSVADPEKALFEMRRVLKPGGSLLLAEHGLAPDASVQKWQQRFEPAWTRMAGGCHLTRDVPALLASSGLKGSRSLQTGYVTRPRAFAWMTWGTLTK